MKETIFAAHGLGHYYRVIVHVVTSKGNNVLTVPIGALFRVNDKWAVFRNVSGRARTVEILIGHRNNRVAEVLVGLSQGDQVVLHPSDRVADGTSHRSTGLGERHAAHDHIVTRVEPQRR